MMSLSLIQIPPPQVQLSSNECHPHGDVQLTRNVSFGIAEASFADWNRHRCPSSGTAMSVFAPDEWLGCAAI